MSYRLSVILTSLSIPLFVASRSSPAQQTEQVEKRQEQLSGEVTVNGATLSYSSEGTGIPVLVLNGSLYTKVFSPALKEHVQLIYVDTRCFIRLDTPDDMSSITMETFVEDIEEVRRSLGLDQIAVLGHSGFGFLPLEYANRYPQHTSHAIVVATTPFFGNDAYRKARDELWETDASAARKELRNQNLEELTPELLDNVTPDQAWIMRYVANGPRFWYDPTYDAAWLWEDREFNIDFVNRYYGVILENYDIREKLDQIDIPVFVALGRYELFRSVPPLE